MTELQIHKHLHKIEPKCKKLILPTAIDFTRCFYFINRITHQQVLE